MNYLLDTHTFLWAVSDTKCLSKKVIDLLKNPNNELFVSSLSLWEISFKVRIKKLDLDFLKPDELINLAEQMEFKFISLTPEEAASYYKLSEQTHNDPFDRMLIWQSIFRNMPIISKDKEFKRFAAHGLRVVW